MSLADWARKNAGGLVSVLGVSVQSVAEYVKDNPKSALAASLNTAGAAIGPLGAFAAAMVNIGTGLFCDGIVKRREAREASKKFLTNEHIARLQAMAIRELIREHADVVEKEEDKKHLAERLRKMADDSEENWVYVVNNLKDPKLDPFKDKHVVEGLTTQLTATAPPAMQGETWRSFLEYANLGFHRTEAIPEPALERVADHLAKHFPEKWKNALKHDFATDGRAYAAMSLHFFAEILTAVKQGQGFDAETKALLKKMPEFANDARDLVDRLKEAKAALLALDDLPGDLRAIVEGTELRLLDAIGKEGETTRRRLSVAEKRTIAAVLITTAVVVAIVMYRTPSPDSARFSTRVRIDQAPGGTLLPHYPALTPHARLTLEAGDLHRVMEIGRGGELYLMEIPADLKGRWLKAKLTDRYWTTASDSVRLGQGDLVVELRPNGVLARVSGSVVNEAGAGIAGILVDISGDTGVTTDAQGRFEAFLSHGLQRDKYKLSLPGHSKAKTANYLPESTPAELVIPRR